MCLEEGKVFEVVLCGMGQMTYHGEARVCLGAPSLGRSYTV